MILSRYLRIVQCLQSRIGMSSQGPLLSPGITNKLSAAFSSTNEFEGSDDNFRYGGGYRNDFNNSRNYRGNSFRNQDRRGGNTFRNQDRREGLQRNQAGICPGLITRERWNASIEFGGENKDQRPQINNLSPESIDEWNKLTDLPVKMFGDAVKNGYSPQLHKSFSDMSDLDPRLLSALASLNLVKPSAIQQYAISILRDGYDLLAGGQTGSGKTVAFLVPLLHNILATYPEEAMQALAAEEGQVQYPLGLILAPTQELAQQIFVQTLKLRKNTPLRSMAFYGGTNINRMLDDTLRGVHIAVATPGRFKDMLSRNALSLKYCKAVVLDEADEMLNMGFEPQIREIMESTEFQLPSPQMGRQTALFSATLSREINTLAHDLINTSPVIIKVGEGGSLPKNIQHKFVWLENGLSERFDRFHDLLKTIDTGERILVFCATKREVDFVDTVLYKKNFKTIGIHGDKSRSYRDTAMKLFKSGKANILVATSVAARGLDIPSVNHVINYQLPREISEYIHRSGRTGRMGLPGTTISFVSSDNLTGTIGKDLSALLSELQQQVPDFLYKQHRSAPDFGNRQKRSGFQNSQMRQRYGDFQRRY